MKIILLIITSFLSFQTAEDLKIEQTAKEFPIVQIDLFKIEDTIKNDIVETSNENRDDISRKDLIHFATTFLGTPYVYAKQDPKVGFDCSGFINYVFKNYNITVPRSSSGFKNYGRKIAIEDVKVGDVLVFTGYRDTNSVGHLGIVSEANGRNSKFIHASSGKVMEVTISDLNSTHYSKRFLHAVDVINQ
ncbi:C40 family peptidase [Flavobacterium psychraquaticum]|uniref:C40 family peptidase n=1 Tax=Flavobacterium psychraquaticum TaxID=3103958 RepID=UPI002ACED945|nr:C40 family peptidase [Flavobacterium sp. LB-N7T]